MPRQLPPFLLDDIIESLNKLRDGNTLEIGVI